MTEFHDWLVGGAAVILGIAFLLAGLFNWDWAFQLRKAQLVEGRFGRNGARWSSALLGLALIALGIGIATDVMPRFRSRREPTQNAPQLPRGWLPSS